MKNLRIYDIVLEDGTHTLKDVVLSMNEEYDWTDVFNELDKILSDSVSSYSYEEVA